jgi:hypothetical protein
MYSDYAAMIYAIKFSLTVVVLITLVLRFKGLKIWHHCSTSIRLI